MSFSINIAQFEGPLDLMLHLVKEQELDLFDLDIALLTEQYLTYLGSMQELHLEIESEYLVELATLIEYKSKRLLPKQEATIDSEYEEDPGQALARRLIMYQKFKDVALELDDLYHDRQRQLAKPMAKIVDELVYSKEENIPIDGNPYELMKAMSKVLRRLQLTKPLEVKYTQKEVSVEERSNQIKSRLIKLPKTFCFEDLIDDCDNIHLAIVTFLSVLDLAKQQILLFTVDDNDTIWFTRGKNERV